MTNTRTLKSRNQREGWYVGKHSGYLIDFLKPDGRIWAGKHCRQGFDQYAVPLRNLKDYLIGNKS